MQSGTGADAAEKQSLCSFINGALQYEIQFYQNDYHVITKKYWNFKNGLIFYVEIGSATVWEVLCLKWKHLFWVFWSSILRSSCNSTPSVQA